MLYLYLYYDFLISYSHDFIALAAPLGKHTTAKSGNSIMLFVKISLCFADMSCINCNT